MKTSKVKQAKFILIFTVLWIVSGYCQSLAFPKEVYKTGRAIPTDKVQVVFYTEKGDSHHVATVKIQERVVGSLPPQHYTEALVCKEKVRAGVADRGKIVKPTHYYDISLNDGGLKNVYYKVDETSDRYYSMTPVDEKEAIDALSKMELKSHIINRYVPSCETSAGNKTN